MKWTPSLGCLLLAVLTLGLNWPECRGLIAHGVLSAFAWSERGYRGNGRYTDAYRELVERFVPLGGSVYYCCDTADGRLQSIERSVHLTLSWAQCPTPVRFGTVEDIDDADAIVGSRIRLVDIPGYRLVAKNDCAALWLKNGVPVSTSGTPRSSCIVLGRELVGVCLVGFLALGAGWLLLRRSCLRSGVVLWVVVAIIIVVAGGLALTHTFAAPTGLGVYGGKAKLVFFHEGIPPGFFTDSSYSTFQPAYPPGLAFLTLVAYFVSGVCGEWLTQLIVVIVMGLLAAFLCSRTDLAMVRLWMLAAMLTPVSLLLSSFYYAEPIVALFVLAGWNRIRERNGDVLGWLLLGLAGLFKNEGCVLLVVCWVSILLLDGRCVASVRGLVVGLAIPFVWQGVCRLAGGTLYDFAAPWNPDIMRLWMAFCMAIRETLFCPWRYAFVWPLTLALLAVRPFRTGLNGRLLTGLRGLQAATLAAGMSIVAFTYILSLSRAYDFDWHLSTSLPRLLWVPSLLLLVEIVRVFDPVPGYCVSNVAKIGCQE